VPALPATAALERVVLDPATATLLRVVVDPATAALSRETVEPATATLRLAERLESDFFATPGTYRAIGYRSWASRQAPSSRVPYWARERKGRITAAAFILAAYLLAAYVLGGWPFVP
jgi:hypothetical protein